MNTDPVPNSSDSESTNNSSKAKKAKKFNATKVVDDLKVTVDGLTKDIKVHIRLGLFILALFVFGSFLYTFGYVSGYSHLEYHDIAGIIRFISDIVKEGFVGSFMQALALLFTLLASGHWLSTFVFADKISTSEYAVTTFSIVSLIISYMVHDETLYGEWSLFSNYWRAENPLHTILLVSGGLALGFLSHSFLFFVRGIFETIFKADK